MTQFQPVFWDIETTGLNPMAQEWWNNSMGAQVTAMAFGQIEGWHDNPDDYETSVSVYYDESEYRLLDVCQTRLREVVQTVRDELDREPFLAGFNIRQFDCPYAGARYARKRLNGDLMTHELKRLDMSRPAVITQDDGTVVDQYPSQNDYAESVGVTVNDEYDGEDMPMAFENREWDKIVSHVESDVEVMMEVFMDDVELFMNHLYDHYDGVSGDYVSATGGEY